MTPSRADAKVKSSGHLLAASGTGVAAREEHMGDEEVPDRLGGLAEWLEQRKPWGSRPGRYVPFLALRAAITSRTRHPVATRAT